MAILVLIFIATYAILAYINHREEEQLRKSGRLKTDKDAWMLRQTGYKWSEKYQRWYWPKKKK